MPAPQLLAQCLAPSSEGSLCLHMNSCLNVQVLTFPSVTRVVSLPVSPVHYCTLPGNVIFHPIPSKNESKTEEQVGTSFLRNSYEGGTRRPRPHMLYCLM